MSSRSSKRFKNWWDESHTNLEVILPEQRLIVAFIGRAMMDFMDPPTMQIFTNAQNFINSPEKDRTFCLFWCLSHISNDPDHLLKSIRKFCIDNRGKNAFKKMHWVEAGYKNRDTIH